MNDLIQGGMEETQIEEKLNEYAIDVAGAVKWVIAAIHLEPDEKVDKAVSLHQQRELIPISVRNLIEENWKGSTVLLCSILPLRRSFWWRSTKTIHRPG